MATANKHSEDPGTIQMPAPTAWPFVTAVGLTLVAAGLVTQLVVSLVGLILALAGAVGWFRDVLPEEEHEWVPLVPEEERARPIVAAPRSVEQLEPGVAGHRVRVPAEIHPYSSGLKGGLLGGTAMAIVACIYGLIAYRSLWYPVNLLAAAAVPSLAQADLSQLTAFNGTGFIVALISHAVFSLLVGLLFAVLLPMLPSRFAAFWGSLTAPLVWSALIWATLRLINPALNDRIDWIWFIASQVAFGLTTGYVVHHSKTVETMQTWPLAARAGLEAPGFLDERDKGQEQ
ncbi:MAG: hypothetical protein GTO40_23380 [Deltaproteobacteria bacterium]|nr:hypothetical protein [Deltaproteobacteria bacterium]